MNQSTENQFVEIIKTHQGFLSTVFGITRRKSKDVMTKLRRNLDFDIWVSSLFIPPLIWVLFQKNIAIYHKYVAAFFIVFIFVGLYYYLKEIKSYKALNLNNDLLSMLKFTEENFRKRVKSLISCSYIAAIPMGFYGFFAHSQK